VSVLGGLELIEDVARELGIAESTLRRWCQRGRFPHRKMPGTRRILIVRADVEAFLSSGGELEVRQLADGGRIVVPANKAR
jgi:excisionase family DNA binding protein